MEDQNKQFTPASAKKILVAGPGSGLSTGKQFVVTQSKGTTIIQPAVVHGAASSAQQQYIVTAVGSQGADHGTSYGAPAAVQYSPDTVVYTSNQQANNNTVQYQYAENYGSPAAHYSYSSPSSQFHGASDVVQHMGQTFFLQGGTMDGEGYPLAHTTRAAPATVKWLLENFEPCEGVSLPRSVLYNFYNHHCSAENVEPSNPASFGKLVRMIFRDLKTRRLGQRGNSRYHYYGIRLKTSSSLNHLMPDEPPVAMRQPTHPQRRDTMKTSSAGEEADSNPITPKSETSSLPPDPSATFGSEEKYKQYLGTAIDAIPQDVVLQVESGNLPEGITLHDANMFSSLYTEHCEAILEIVITLQFSEIENLWQQFWRRSARLNSPMLEAKLPRDKLYVLSRMSEVQNFVKQMDYSFYQSLVEVLIPDVLRPIPSTLTQTIRNFAKGLEGWLKSALNGVPEEILKTKLTVLTAFSQTLRRYTSLNHLAQAARAVLVNSAQIQQMMADLSRVNFSHIQEQAAWVCQCSDSMVSQIEENFKVFLQGQHSLEEWKDWLERILDEVLVSYEGQDTYSKAARNFLLKWSFYGSMVIRDLTLRSAASFGSFHLIRLLYDEYMFYLVEHKVAAATSRTPIAVMSELIENNDQMRLANEKKALVTNISRMETNTAVSLLADTGSGDNHAAKRFKSENDPLGVAMNAFK